MPSSDYLAPSACSGATCSSSPTPSPPAPHRQSAPLPDAPRYYPNSLGARGETWADPAFVTAAPIPTSMPTLADLLPALDVVTTSSNMVSPTPTSTPPADISDSQLSTAAIIRIAIGAGIGVGFLAIALICLFARRRNLRRAEKLAVRRNPPAGPEAYVLSLRSQAGGRGGQRRASSDSSTIVPSVVDHDRYGRDESGMAGKAQVEKASELV